MLHDNVFLRALGNNLLLAALSVLVQLPLAFALALLIRRNLAGRTVFRVIFFLPYVLSEVITGVLWLFIYNPQVGLLNKVLSVIPGFKPQGWLGDTNMVFYALFVVITWKYFGLHLILYTAGLQNVPAELEEAAVIDGASSRAGDPLRHHTDARAYTAPVAFSFGARFAADFRPDLGDDHRRPGKCQPDDGDLHLQVRLQELRYRIRQRRGRGAVHHLLCFLVPVPALRYAARLPDPSRSEVTMSSESISQPTQRTRPALRSARSSSASACSLHFWCWYRSPRPCLAASKPTPTC